ncbi:AGMO [Cordylochernes scorpioides]|uniref:AGMO n=1 Tax=Cordylochernes scorpioides TaxID=51811 RepID=A0ABY6KJG7_9ARAC|nr:AGMO [Cordylochernes scorpioides]
MAAAVLERVGYLFYVVHPERTKFREVAEVPEYVREVLPIFAVVVILEQAVGLFKGGIRINDSITSIFQGVLHLMFKVVLRGVDTAAYLWVYQHLRWTTLPWDSTATWLLAMIGCDLGYYWLHRASHEVNVLWGAHQVHHSSEEYNLSTALRQSVLQHQVTWMFYLPLAFIGLPPPIFLVHAQFNTLYQFWIHTQHVRSLGPLEYILNTPSHHRVHHGRNRYCIDKNYAGTLIIWDRLFGTFAPEEEEVVYGLTHPLTTFNPLQIQLCHYKYMWDTFWSTPGFTHKLSVIFKGPGWGPGKPWRGVIEDIPDVHAPQEPYNPQLPTWCNVYVYCAAMMVIFTFIATANVLPHFTAMTTAAIFVFIGLSTITVGEMLDKNPLGFYLEMVRCLLYFPVESFVVASTPQLFAGLALYGIYALRAFYASCICFWAIYLARSVTIKTKSA